MGAFAFFVLSVAFWCFPVVNKTHKPWAPVLLDARGQLLSAQTASDGQWRFPTRSVAPERFAKCLMAFEDKRFLWHWGIDPLAIARAFRENLSQKKVVSGGSTITMQAVRQALNNQKRTYFQKFYEIILSIRLEFSLSKEEILALHASTAPFGANVVGIDAASWRWFGHSPEKLSWAEAATLAVLPNQPTLINPKNNRHLLQKKRDKLLMKMLANLEIDSNQYFAAINEPLPLAPRSLPRYATHLLNQEIQNNRTLPPWKTHINLDLQVRAEAEVSRYCGLLANNGVHHAAVMIRDVKSGQVLARVGNCPRSVGQEQEGDWVDIASSMRSTGSLLKPFLYAQMLESQEIMPEMLVADIPTRFGSYAPKNYDMDYRGSIAVNKALAQSLNVPAVRLLHQYGSDRFLSDLHHWGLKGLNRSASAYGLSLILGGGESSLEELTMAYVELTQLAHGWIPQNNSGTKQTALVRPEAAWQTLKALEEVNRPQIESAWRNFSSVRRVGWKTGTSFGFRDAWAIGSDGQFVVGVWAGNADGEGRPGLTGIDVAAPILFDLFGLLPAPQNGTWPSVAPNPKGLAMRQIEVCEKSGHPAGAHCPKKILFSTYSPQTQVSICPYHKKISLDPTTQEQVDSRCFSVQRMQSLVAFQLPPAQEFYYRKQHPDYAILPPWKAGCEPEESASEIEILYPMPGSRILPSQKNPLQGNEVVLEAAHRFEQTPLLWYIDQEFVGQTQVFHQLSLNLKSGKHTLVVMDSKGTRVARSFEVIR